MKTVILALLLLGESAPKESIELVSPGQLRTKGLGGIAMMFSDESYGGSVADGRILVSTNSRVFKRAERGDRDSLVMLASLVKHEETHIKLGNCEAEPYRIQLRVYDELGGLDNDYRKVIVDQIKQVASYPCISEAAH